MVWFKKGLISIALGITFLLGGFGATEKAKAHPALPGIRKHDDTLRIKVGKTYCAYMPKCKGVLYHVARKGIKVGGVSAISWRGRKWRGRRSVVLVARTLLNKHDPRKTWLWTRPKNSTSSLTTTVSEGYGWLYSIAAQAGNLVTSTYRSPGHNAAVGGAPQSSHLKWGCAGDVDGGNIGLAASIAHSRGYSTISGYADGHLHIQRC